MKAFVILLGLASAITAVPLNDAPVESPIENEVAGDKRRGIAFNNPAYTILFNSKGHKTTWIYNWASRVEGAEGPFEYVPMLWSSAPEHTGRWFADVEHYARMGPGTTHVLSFNEPDQCGGGGACMGDVQSTIAEHKNWLEPLRKYGDKIMIGSPAVTNGGPPMGVDYLKRFLEGCDGCKIDFICVHWYNSAKNVDDFKKHIEGARKIAGGRPIWITEFAPTGGSEQEVEDFLKDVLPWLDQQPDVHRYAMQWADKGSLVNGDGNGLSTVGNLYNTY